ncbi:hypothetical protein F2P79_009042 [Pimephales promelas]|nr:hypothetical protein F2P79_009042 [Pimephales promelas]
MTSIDGELKDVWTAFTVEETWTHHTHTAVSVGVLHTPGLCSSEKLRRDLRLKGHEEDSAHDLPRPLFSSGSTSGLVIPVPAGDPLARTHTAFAVIGKVNPRRENDV